MDNKNTKTNFNIKGIAEADICAVKDKGGCLKTSLSVSFNDILFSNGKKFSFKANKNPKMFLEDSQISGETVAIATEIGGTVKIETNFMGGAKVVRTYSASLNHRAIIIKIEVTNNSPTPAMFSCLAPKAKPSVKKSKKLSLSPLEYGTQITDANGDFRSNKPLKKVEKKLVSGATAIFYTVFYCLKQGDILNFNAETEMKKFSKESVR
ncbi:MAG: hypothetical protein FWD49_07325 [Firmicutes bacterium]|nr:hypothetical protein [Bacillota bacterium]